MNRPRPIPAASRARLRGWGRLAAPLGAALVLLSLPARAADAVPARPNIVLIVADDLGFGDLGAYGATRIRTPNLDRLAAAGVRFTNGYAPSSTCTPTRYSMFTGEYAWRQSSKRTGILPGDAPLSIEPGRLTLPEALRRAGYFTGAIGKWHLGLGDGRTAVDFNQRIKPGPLDVGFDYCHIIPATVDRVPSVWIENDRVVGLDPADPITVSYEADLRAEPNGLDHPEQLRYGADKQHSGTIINRISRIGFMSGGQAARFKDEELTSTVVNKAVRFLEAHGDRPFFLYVGLFEPHVPRVAEPPFVGTSELGVRGEVIQQMDAAAGEILNALDRLHLAENTLVIFTSDNGPVLFDGYHDGAAEKNQDHRPAGGLRGWKYLVYEGGCRVPLIARWPARLQPRVTGQMFSLVDLPATLGRIGGAEISATASPDSLDLSPVLLGETTENLRDHTVLHGISDTLALRVGDWKYIPANTRGRPAGTGGANPSEARFTPNQIPSPLLFNLREDPAEEHNVIGQFPEKGEEMQRRLDAIRQPPAGRG
jgi:arylsulfatase A-like enzyme